MVESLIFCFKPVAEAAESNPACTKSCVKIIQDKVIAFSQLISQEK